VQSIQSHVQLKLDGPDGAAARSGWIPVSMAASKETEMKSKGKAAQKKSNSSLQI
jgi:hypothetical protein